LRASVDVTEARPATRQLIKAAEAALKHLENTDSGIEDTGGVPSPLKVFSAEEAATSARRSKRFLGGFTYPTCFRLIFFLFGFGGLAGT
jgi:hypothetical protein